MLIIERLLKAYGLLLVSAQEKHFFCSRLTVLMESCPCYYIFISFQFLLTKFVVFNQNQGGSLFYPEMIEYTLEYLLSDHFLSWLSTHLNPCLGRTLLDHSLQGFLFELTEVSLARGYLQGRAVELRLSEQETQANKG